jgi:hypothetical protein
VGGGDREVFPYPDDAQIAYQLFIFGAERILKGIADNFAELINESTHFCSPNLEPKQITLTDSSVLV